MGFLSALKGIGKVAGKGALGMLTGGPVGAAIGAGGAIAGSVAKGREDRRDIEGGQQFQLDALRNAQTLNAEQAQLQAERQRMRQMIASDLLGSMAPPSDPRAQKFLNRGSINENTMQRMRDSAVKTTPDISMPQFAGMPKAGKMDTFLNLLGGVGAFSNLMQNKPKVNPDGEWAETHGTYDNAGY